VGLNKFTAMSESHVLALLRPLSGMWISLQKQKGSSGSPISLPGRSVTSIWYTCQQSFFHSCKNVIYHSKKAKLKGAEYNPNHHLARA